MSEKKPTIFIGNVFSHIENISKEMQEELYDTLAYEIPDAKFVIANRPGWDGMKRLFSKKGNKFLSGLAHMVCKCIHDKFGVTPIVYRPAIKPEKTLHYKWNPDFVVRDYQTPLVKTLTEKSRGVLNACTGSGKTVMVAKTIHEIGASPFIFYVLTRDLMYQAKKVLEATIVGLEVGVIGDGICDIKEVNVMTVQTATCAFSSSKKDFKKEQTKLKNSAEFDDVEAKEFRKENLKHVDSKKKEIVKLIKDAVGIYADEVHHFAAETCRKILTRSPNAYYRFGGSATPERADGAYLVIEGLFGRRTATVTASDLIRRGYLLKPNIRFIELETKKRMVNTFPEDRATHIVENEERNECIVRLANKLIEKKISTLVLVQMIDHGKALEKMIPGSVFVHGGTKKKDREEGLRKLAEGEIPLLIGSVIADEGLDIPTLSALIIAGGGKSSTKAKQRVGRVIRTGSPFSLVYDFMDVGRWTKKHSEARIKILEEEEEFVVSRIKSSKIYTPQKDLF